jgi:hypothetical protein
MSKTNYSKVKTDEGKGIYVRFYKNEKFDKTDPECTQPVGSVLFMLDGKKYRAGLWQEKPDENGEKRCDYSGALESDSSTNEPPRKSQQKPSPVAADDDIPF